MNTKKNTFRNKEAEQFLTAMQKYKTKVTKTEESSKRFLVELGVITKKGNPTKHYKNLCIPDMQE
jgi:hypothetical protein